MPLHLKDSENTEFDEMQINLHILLTDFCDYSGAKLNIANVSEGFKQFCNEKGFSVEPIKRRSAIPL